MIGSLSGRVAALYTPFVVLDVNGVGYEIETPLTTYCELTTDDSVLLWVHLVVREDAQLLYGFLTQSERNVFRILIKINGVGAKLAVAILSHMSAATLANHIKAGDAAALTSIPGIGKKTAQRLVVELKDKLDAHTHKADTNSSAQSADAQQSLLNTAEHEVEAALHSLGYTAKETSGAIEKAKTEKAKTQTDTASLTTEKLLKLALKQLMRQ